MSSRTRLPVDGHLLRPHVREERGDRDRGQWIGFWIQQHYQCNMQDQRAEDPETVTSVTRVGV